MAAANFSRDEFKMFYDKLGEKDDFLQTIYDTTFGFNLRQEQFSEKKKQMRKVENRQQRILRKTMQRCPLP